MPKPITTFGPDFPFAYDDWLSNSAGLGLIPDDKLGTEVAIIGAGVSGMVAAFELMKLGLTPVIYESGRMGGRLRSVEFPNSHGIVAELGGMRFPESSTTLFHYINKLGLKTRPFPNPLTLAAGSTIIDLAGEPVYAETIDDLPVIYKEVAEAWNSALETQAHLIDLQTAIRERDAVAIKKFWDPLVREWDNRTFYDFLASAPSFKKLSFRHREIFGQVGFGTGGWDSDFRNTMLEILRVVLTELDDDQHLIVGGAEQIPRSLWHRSVQAPHHGECSLNFLHRGATRAAVKKIQRSGDEIAITDQYHNTKNFKAALATCQSWLLTTSIDTDETLFSQENWMALDRTSYMQSSKTFVMVDRPFWKDRDPKTKRQRMSMTLTDRITRGTYLFDNGNDRPGVICLSYTWMADAMKMLPLPVEQRVELAVSALEKIYPDVKIRKHIIGQPITISWEADPNFLGAFKGALPGHYRYNRRMFTHFMQEFFPATQKGIFIAGDDVSWTPGWAEGAVQTGLNAVWGITHHLGGRSAPGNPGPGDVFKERLPVELD
ncbi:MAG: NAD(P)/FAD-dependent oxidoreductase [Granulosicoccaceae bacterium]